MSSLVSPPPPRDAAPASSSSRLSGSDALAAYHAGSEHRFTAYAPGPDVLDWDHQPAAFRRYDGAPVVRLPAPVGDAADPRLHRRLAQPAGPVIDVLLQGPTVPVGGRAVASPVASPVARPVAPPIDPATLDLHALSLLLHLAAGITAWKEDGGTRWAVRANPSSGNLHPVELWLLCQGLPPQAGLSDGVWHYRPDDHALERRAAPEPTSATTPASAAEPSSASASSTAPAGVAGPAAGSGWLALGLSLVPWREAWKYGTRAWRYCLLDAGHARAGLRVAAAALGWSIDDGPTGSAALDAVLGLDRDADFGLPRTRPLPWLAGHRPSPEPEREWSDGLLTVHRPSAAPTSPPDWLSRPDRLHFEGRASVIDRRPMHRWPAVEGAIVASRAASGIGSGIAAGIPAAAAADVTTDKATRLLDSAVAPGRPHAPRGHPLPGSSGGDALLGPVVLGRRSAQRFDRHRPMPAAAWQRMVHGLQQLLATPAARALDARIGLFVHRVDGVAAGVWRLGPDGLGAMQAADAGTLHRVARSLHCHQDLAANACVALGLLVDLDGALARSPSAYRDAHHLAGHIGQWLYLQAEAAGLRGCGIGCFFDGPVRDALAGPAAGTPIYHFTVGWPLADTRLPRTPHDTWVIDRAAAPAAPNASAPAAQPTPTPAPSASPPVKTPAHTAMPPAAPPLPDAADPDPMPSDGSRHYGRLSAAQALERLAALHAAGQPYTLFDTRPPADHAAGHLPGAVRFQEADFPAWLRRLDRQAPVFLYCVRGQSSRVHAQTFADFRFTSVWSIDGGWNALAPAHAARAGRRTPGDALQAFLRAWGHAGDDIDAAGANGLTPLMRAALAGESALVAELLALGASVARRNGDGNTALWLACVSDDPGVVEQILAAGADIDHANDTGATALMYCASAGRDALVSLLLERGANPRLTTQDGFTALDLASTEPGLRRLRQAMRA